MPAIEKGSLVLVTGASGFIASHTVDVLLQNGYKVRGTVRSTEKGEFLKNLFKGKPFEYVVVEDLQDEHGFDEAVKGVSGIAHMASPFYLNATSVAELVGPAVAGTTGVLKSALKNDSGLKRVVITSSVAAIMDPSPVGEQHKGGAPFAFTESDWNEYSPKVCEKEGDAAPGGDKYRASKTLAEKSAWAFIKENSPAWDIATINPPLVFGPIIHQCETPDKLNTSAGAVWNYVQAKVTEESLGVSTGNWVDVRDVAFAHYKALVTEEAGGERFIVGAGAFNGQEIVDILHAQPGDIKGLPVGKPGTGPEINSKANVFVGKKAEKVLGVEYMTLEKSILDTVKSLKERFA